MTQRMNLPQVAPELYRALAAVEVEAKKGLDPTLVHLVKIRASQINHCAFCIDMHTKDARAEGETEQRIYLLNAWQEVPQLYTDAEQAALALAESVTVLTDGFVPDDVYARAEKQFQPTELAHLIGVLIAINSWNRMCVTTRTAAGHHRPEEFRRLA